MNGDDDRSDGRGGGASALSRSARPTRLAIREFCAARLTAADCVALKTSEWFVGDLIGVSWRDLILVRLVIEAANGDAAAARLVLDLLGGEAAPAPSENAVADPEDAGASIH